MGKTAEGQDNGNPTNVFAAKSLDTVSVSPLDATTDLDFAAQGETDGPLPKGGGNLKFDPRILA